MITYRIATKDDTALVEDLLAASLDGLPTPTESEVILAEEDGKAVAALHLTFIPWIGQFCVHPEWRGAKVSFESLLEIAEIRLKEILRKHNMAAADYITFQTSKANSGRLHEMGYRDMNYNVFAKTVGAD